jgi:uncharacterized SAM-binding protein YcdF (DUF218 family)
MLTLLKALVLPPLALFVVAGVGLALLRRRPKLARWLIGASSGLLLLLCLPWVSAALLKSLQASVEVYVPGQGPPAQAIVVLGGDFHSWAPELGGAAVGPLTLERLRYGARLARETGLPLLVSGGKLDRRSPPLAELMAESLRRDFGLETRWIEARSGTTRQNADNAAELLRAAGVERVLVVSQAWHLPRSVAAFEDAGLQAIPAPTGFRSWPHLDLAGLLPSARSLRESSWAIHEWIGRLWYALGG